MQGQKYAKDVDIKIDNVPEIDIRMHEGETIEKFVPAISTLKHDFNEALIEALNSIVPMSKTDNITDKVMRFIFAKRVSNYFDEDCGEETPPPWIQYICPPIAKSLCVCDVIKKIPTTTEELLEIGEPDEYRVILTPSCDMAQHKVSNILCAKCYEKTAFHSMGTAETPKPRNLDRIKSYLNTGYNNSFVSLPGLPESIPYLAVNLKQLEFIPLEKIALNSKSITPEQHSYFRVASIDSPFREQLVWAYMLISCRPGMPDRNMDLRAKELMKP